MNILLDTIKDTYLMIPLLLITYLLLEHFEHTNYNFTRLGPILGACIGLIPQCGFSVLASLLFVEKKISMGTLISVFIATSDEAIPILIAYPKQMKTLFLLIMMKFIIAIIIGYIVDYLYPTQLHDISIHSSSHSHHSPFKDAILRTIKIYSFIFITNSILSYIIESVGTDTFSSLLLHQSLMQPIISALFGFIPNCAASVILTQLYIRGILSFASLLAGLMTNAGLGIVALIHHRVNKTTLLKICIILLFSSLVFSIPLQWFSIL